MTPIQLARSMSIGDQDPRLPTSAPAGARALTGGAIATFMAFCYWCSALPLRRECYSIPTRWLTHLSGSASFFFSLVFCPVCFLSSEVSSTVSCKSGTYNSGSGRAHSGLSGFAGRTHLHQQQTRHDDVVDALGTGAAGDVG